MFFSSPSIDLRIMIYLLIFSLVISLITYYFTRKVLISIFVFLFLSNFIIIGNLNYNYAKIYNIFWLYNFAKHYLPYINLAIFFILLFNYFRNKHAKK